jgi:hypothetical protein
MKSLLAALVALMLFGAVDGSIAAKRQGEADACPGGSYDACVKGKKNPDAPKWCRRRC